MLEGKKTNMGIDVEWVNENHEPMQQVFDASGVLTCAISNLREFETGGCLQFVDPSGGAVSNQGQLSVSLEELCFLYQKTSDADLKKSCK